MPLADWEIERRAIVTPSLPIRRTKTPGIVSFGPTSYGYDLRAAEQFYLFGAANMPGGVIDPKKFDDRCLVPVVGDCIIPPNSFALTHSVERLAIPRDTLAIVVGKSTYARAGLIVNVTPLEPDWRGHVTIEVSNTAPLPIHVYANEGIAQVVFLPANGPNEVLRTVVLDMLRRGVEAAAKTWLEVLPGNERDAAGDLWTVFTKAILNSLCQVSYADKGGRYQDQAAKVMLPCATGDQPVSVDSTGRSEPPAKPTV